jgi:putative membrane protein
LPIDCGLNYTRGDSATILTLTVENQGFFPLAPRAPCGIHAPSRALMPHPHRASVGAVGTAARVSSILQGRCPMTSRTHLALAAAAALTLGSVSFAQQSSSSAGGAGGAGASGASGQISSAQSGQSGQADQQMQQQLQQIAQDPNTAADKLFVLEAAKGNLKEQMLGQAVAQKAQKQEVKQLAQRIAQDHAQAQQQLQQTAQQLQLQLPQSLPQTEQLKIQIIASLPADQLEKHYVAGMHADHARDILKYQHCSQMSQNDQVKQYAQQTLAVLQQHHQQTMQVAQSIGVQTGMEAITAGASIPAGGSAGRSDSSGTGTGGTGTGTSGTGTSGTGTGTSGGTSGSSGSGTSGSSGSGAGTPGSSR